MTPEDDYTHSPTDESDFNESMYFHLHDPDLGVGGFFRIANRPNEGRGERTVCIYLPDGRVAFGYDRPAVQTNDRLDAAGMRVTVVTPFERIDVAFTGAVSILDEPTALEDPKTALSSSISTECTVDLTLTTVAEAFAESFDRNGGSFAPNHYEQPMAGTGTIRIGAETFSIDGHGLRDHSWGPRSWQAPWFYRWLHGVSGELSFMAAYFGTPDESVPAQGGFVNDRGRLVKCDSVLITTERDDRTYQRAITVTLTAGSENWTFVGEVMNAVPLRHRDRNGEAWSISRIVEGSTAWSADDGRQLHGMSEYYDRIIDGAPVGLSV